MGNSSSNTQNTFVETKEQIIKASSDATYTKIDSDFRLKIENFSIDFARDGENHFESDRFEMVHESLKAPVYFKIRVSLKNGKLDLSIVNDNDRDVWAKSEFYVIDKHGYPIHQSKLDVYEDYRWHCQSNSRKLLDMNRIRNEKHEKIENGKTGCKISWRASYLMKNWERLMPGRTLTIGCKFSLSV